MTTLQPDPLDKALGAIIRLQRKRLAMSQSALGHVLGVSFQQVQKYERGTNRVSFSTLSRIAAALNCRVSELIGDLDGVAGADHMHSSANLLAEDGALQLVESYNKIRSKALRAAVLDLSRKLSAI